MVVIKRACCLVSAIIALSSHAEQLSFSVEQDDGQHHYRYQWRDANAQTFSIAFTLSRQRFEELHYVQPAYKAELAARQLRLGLLEYAQQIDPRLARIEVHQHREQVTIEVHGKDAQQVADIQQQLSTQRDALTHQFLSERLYRQHLGIMGQHGIIPDYAAHVIQQAPSLIPVSQAFYEMLPEKSDARAYIDLVLSWSQSIPYDALDNRMTSHGAGFLPPIGLIDQNKGDCDSKSALVAALIRAFLPTTPLTMVLLREHALLAIALPVLKNDQHITIEQREWVLFDPTGPALFPFGRISETTMREITNQQYQLLPIPTLSSEGG